MIRDRLPPDDERADSRPDTSAPLSRPRLVLGLFVLALVAGYVVLQFVGGVVPGEIGVLVPSVGVVLGAALLAEHVTPRCRSALYRGLCLPAIELAATYALFGALVVTLYSGLAATGAVSGLLLFCGFLSFILTL